MLYFFLILAVLLEGILTLGVELAGGIEGTDCFFVEFLLLRLLESRGASLAIVNVKVPYFHVYVNFLCFRCVRRSSPPAVGVASFRGASPIGYQIFGGWSGWLFRSLKTWFFLGELYVLLTQIV